MTETRPSETPTESPAEPPSESPGESASPPDGDEPSPDPSESDAPVDPMITPTVTLNATARLVKYGSTPTVTFTVAADDIPMAQQPVSVCVAVGSAPFDCTDATTDDTGTLAWPRRATAPFRIRLAVPATDSTDAVTSATANYKVQAVATAARAGAKALSVAIGGIDRQTVQVQRLDGTRWVTAKKFRAAAHTTVTGLTAGSATAWWFRAPTVFAGTTTAVVSL